MSKGQAKLQLSDRLATALSHEHAGLLDLIDELTPYVHNNPDDAWAAGQLRWSMKRVKQLEEKLGLAKNRAPR